MGIGHPNNTTENSDAARRESPSVTQKALTELLCSKRTRKINESEQFNMEEVIADGSCHSIIKWSLREERRIVSKKDGTTGEMTVKIDKDQRRAFQLTVSKFVLSFVTESQMNNKDRFSVRANKKFIETKTI